MGQWQSYVDDNLIGSGKFSRAAVIGLAGGQWAASDGFTLSDAEQRSIVTGFSDPVQIQSSGFRLGGVKYSVVSCEPLRIYAKASANGCVLVKTQQAVLVGEYQAPVQAGEAAPVVEQLGDYLRSVGY